MMLVRSHIKWRRLYEGRTSFCTRHFSRKLCRFLLMFLTDFTSLNVFFFLYRSPFLALCKVFNSISTNMDDVLSINPFTNVFVFQGFNIHHKDWIPILVELIDLVNSVIIFLSQMTLDV